MIQNEDGSVHFKVNTKMTIQITSTHEPKKQIPAGSIFIFVGNTDKLKKKKNTPIKLCLRHCDTYFGILGSEKDDMSNGICGKHRGLKWQIPATLSHTYESQIQFQCATTDVFHRRNDMWIMKYVHSSSFCGEQILFDFAVFKVCETIRGQSPTTIDDKPSNNFNISAMIAENAVTDATIELMKKTKESNELQTKTINEDEMQMTMDWLANQSLPSYMFDM